MSEFTCDITVKSNSDNRLELDIKGNNEYGLDKTIVNAIRRTLLSSIETYAFRTDYEKPGIKSEINNTSLHNEYILDRIGLIPLYLDTKLIEDNPLKYLLLENLDLQSHFDLVFTETNDQYSINLSEKGKNNNLEKITLYFNRDSFELKKWDIFNESGEKTSLEFTNIIKNISIGADKFVIHYNNTNE